jgi:hypothetical protein|tara:strand:- start:3780 stop:3938 length:159 start_codon:yes stop_codon:yes gene_type:complete
MKIFKDPNKKLKKNLEKYAEKKKIKQQESKIHEQKSETGKGNKKTRTRLYHL